jgi:transcriptional regulator with XRE-family HTH domain
MSDNTTTSPIKTVRLALNLTQEEMAAKLGCSITSERRFEYDGTLPKVKAVLGNFKKLAKQAGIEIEVTA